MLLGGRPLAAAKRRKGRRSVHRLTSNICTVFGSDIEVHRCKSVRPRRTIVHECIGLTLWPIPTSKMHPRNRSPCQPIARPSFPRTRPPLSIRALRSARDHALEVATHTNARDPILDPEIIALATGISFGTLYILELPIAPGIV